MKTKNKMTKLALALGTVATVAAPIAAVVSCGSESYDPTHIRFAYEKSWKPVIQKAIETLTPEEQKKIDLVEIADGKSVDYLDQVQNKPAAGSTADIFAAPVDHYSALASGNVVLDVTKDIDMSKYSSKSIGLIDGKHYAYPINTESVIQIFNVDKMTGTDKSGTEGYSTLEAALGDDTFVTQWANLWDASAAINPALVPAADTSAPDGVADKWVKKGADGKWTAPIISSDDADSTKIIKALFDANNKLRSGGTWRENIANGVERDANIREHLANKDISGIIDGPWAINDLVARILKANPTVADLVPALNNLRAAKLPTIGAVNGVSADVAASHMRHMKGGWGYSINAAKLHSMNVEEGTAKKELEEKLLAAVTSADMATAWFQAGAKLSAAEGGQVAITDEIMKGMQLTDPTAPDGAKLSFPDDPTVVSALSDLYTSVSNAVSEQADYNVDQPSGDGWALWNSWDKNGLSNAEVTTSNQFWDKFKQDVAKVMTDANSK